MLAEPVFFLVGELGRFATIVIVQEGVDFSQPVSFQEISDALLVEEEQLRDQGNGNAFVNEKYGVCPAVLLRGMTRAVKHCLECVTLT